MSGPNPLLTKEGEDERIEPSPYQREGQGEVEF